MIFAFPPLWFIVVMIVLFAWPRQVLVLLLGLVCAGLLCMCNLHQPDARSRPPVTATPDQAAPRREQATGDGGGSGNVTVEPVSSAFESPEVRVERAQLVRLPGARL
jgi:hypothetical protein